MSKAGSRIRKYARGEVSEEQYEKALDTMLAFRGLFPEPLVKVNNGLRKFCRSLDIEPEVSQRLKKAPTIVDKLSRESGLDLWRMQDIGGCRVVLDSIKDVREMEAKIRQTWGHQIHRVSDYIEEPRESGYRALHMVVSRDNRLIEIQLRTTVMHEWAMTVEAFSGSAQENFKQDGDHLVQQFLRVFSQVMAYTESGESAPRELLDKGSTLGDQVRHYLASR